LGRIDVRSQESRKGRPQRKKHLKALLIGSEDDDDPAFENLASYP